jgi:hypothetical protein
MRWMETLHEYD